jgi:Rieske Fe-S protein
MDCPFSRRDFLRGLAGVAGLVLVGVTASGYADDRDDDKEEKKGLKPVTAVANDDGTYTIPNGAKVKPGTALLFVLPKIDEPGFLFQTAKGEWRALSAICTHRGAKLEWEQHKDGATLYCPRHGSEFDTDGQVIAPPARKALQHFIVTIHEDDALISLPAKDDK